jgi:protein-disulfide isomerase
MTIMFTKSVVVPVVLVALMGFGRGLLAEATVPADAMSERVLGDPNAPVTIIEYSSLTCPHCATFHNDVLPKIKAEFLNTGKAKLVYRDFPLDRVALKASLLARCAPKERYFTFLNALFKQQARWSRAEDPVAALSMIGRIGGIGEEAFQACMSDETLANYVLQQRADGQKEYSIDSTPTFVINGEIVKGALSFESFKSVIENAVK